MIFAASQMVQKKERSRRKQIVEGIWVFMVVFVQLFCRLEIFSK